METNININIMETSMEPTMETLTETHKKPIQLGLCCINTQLRQHKPPIFSSRKIILRTIQEKGISYLKEKVIQNLRDTLVLMDWNETHGIKVFRLSSDLFPHKSNTQLYQLIPEAMNEYTFDFARDLLREIGKKAKQYHQRLTFHPGQYNVIGTPCEKTFKKTLIDLAYHAQVLDLMQLDKHSVMVVHGGGIYGDKEKTIDRWCIQFKQLPEYIQQRLVLENCERSFSILDCLEISRRIQIPVVFDTHHHECYCLLHPEEIRSGSLLQDPTSYMKFILDSWKPRDIKPKFHISEQGEGRCGHHSDFIETVPDYLLNIPSLYHTSIDIMIEAKMKEKAIFKLYDTYPELKPILNQH
jgi:UV DNA damage endonuclease